MIVGGEDETVDQLLQKLAKKGKKIKILDDNENDESVMTPDTQRNGPEGDDDDVILEEIKSEDVRITHRGPNKASKNKNTRTIVRESTESVAA